MIKNSHILLVGLLIAVFQLSCGDKKTKVTVEEVKRRDIVQTVSASGKIYPQTEVKISSDVSGEIVELNVAEGDSVQKGDVLAVIDPEAYKAIVERVEAGLSTSRSSLANAQARLTQSEAQLENVEADYKRKKTLFEQGVISQSEFEAAETSYKSAQADVEAARQNVLGARYSIRSAEASLKEARDNLVKTVVYAPSSGVVSALNVEQGERVVGTSQFAGTEMMKIANLSEMEVQVDVSENDIIRVGLEDTAIIEVDAYFERKFKGIVSEIASSANMAANQLATDQVTDFKVKIRILRASYQNLIDQSKGPQNFPFRPGMSASVDIQTRREKNTLSVPIQSVTTREPSKRDRDTVETEKKNEKALQEIVFVVKEGKAEKVVVKTGIQDDTYIQIKEGLEEGAEVISAPYSAISRTLDDDDPVEKVEKGKLYEGNWKKNKVESE